MSTADQPSTIDSAQTERLAALRDRARHLLESQRARIRLVEAQLSEQVAALFEQVRIEKREALEKQSALHERLEVVEAELPAARKAQRESERVLAEARDGLEEALQQQNLLRRQLAETGDLLESRTRQLEEAQQALRDGGAPPASPSGRSEATAGDAAQLETECERLRSELEKLRSADTSGQQGIDELRERFEQAVQEVRELNTRNEQLTTENARLQAQHGSGTPAVSADNAAGGFDWETQKQMLLLQLETDFNDGDSAQVEAKLTIEGAIRITDQVVAEKEQEIAELKRLLNEQSGNIGDMAIGAAAVAGALDQDELIREERENLRTLQEEWREKLRQAEVDVSVERAKIARERMQLEEQLQQLQSEKDSIAAQGTQEDGSRKPTGGNWLSRLGLKDDENE